MLAKLQFALTTTGRPSGSWPAMDTKPSLTSWSNSDGSISSAAGRKGEDMSMMLCIMESMTGDGAREGCCAAAACKTGASYQHLPAPCVLRHRIVVSRALAAFLWDD